MELCGHHYRLVEAAIDLDETASCALFKILYCWPPWLRRRGFAQIVPICCGEDTGGAQLRLKARLNCALSLPCMLSFRADGPAEMMPAEGIVLG